MLTFKIILCLILTTHAAVLVDNGDIQSEERTIKVRYLDPDSIIHYTPVERHRGFFENDLRTYCYRGNAKTLARLFESIELQLDIDGDDYTQYEGATPREVYAHYEEQRSLFSFSLFSQKRTRLQMSPFEQQCIGIVTFQPYRVRLQQTRIDFWRVIQLLLGVFAFIYAGRLSQNDIFYYITGVLVGIGSSFMLLIWLSSKLLPRRTMMYGALIGGWTIGLYMVQMIWQNLQTIILTYRTYVFWYILVTGTVSFFFCYRWGPPKNRRSRNIIKWSMQLLAIALIYLSSYFEEATIAIALVTVLLHYFPLSLWYRLRGLYLRRFPPKRRLLTNEEYYEQGVRETTKALEELRTYASSPDCKQWRVMSKLRDPLRFAAFVEGASHLRDEEILRFESTTNDDDELDVSTDDEEEHVDERSHQNHYNSYEQMQRKSHNVAARSAGYVEISDDEDADEPGIELPYVEVPRRRTPQLTNHASARRALPDVSASSPSAFTATRRESPRVFADPRTPTRASYMLSVARSQNDFFSPNHGRSSYI